MIYSIIILFLNNKCPLIQSGATNNPQELHDTLPWGMVNVEPETIVIDTEGTMVFNSTDLDLTHTYIIFVLRKKKRPPRMMIS